MSRRYEVETRGHTWKRNEEGHVDIGAFDADDFHNGPACVTCGYGFCHHCQELPSKDCKP